MTTMVLSETMTRDGPQRSHILKLPIELHFCIRDQLLTDPDTTDNELRPLRLVCKSFNDIWSPVVATNMMLFRTGYSKHALAQLRHIVHGKSNASTLAAYTTLTIQNLYCVDTEGDRWYSDARRLCERGIIAVLIWMIRMLIAALFWFIALALLLIYSALTVYPILFGILCLAALLADAIIDINRAMPKFRARYYMALLPRKLNMGNIRRVRLFLHYNCSDWAIYRSTRILLSLPNFTELELCLAETMDLEYLVRCLEPLKGLHKLTLFPETTPSYLQCIAALISNNENLTHFDWRLGFSPDISALFCDVPTTKPLRLQHLSLSRGCTNFDALVPHIRSLTSVGFGDRERNRWCIPFSRAKIFPSTIKVELLDQELVTFISGHPGLVSLTIGSSWTTGVIEELVSSLCKALTHHSETLQRIFFCHKILAFILLRNEENKANFLQSTCNLREFVLLPDYYVDPTIYSEQSILSFVAHMSPSFAVIISTHDKAIFFQCVAFCRDSGNPFIRDLVGRTVYERV